jgi:hypothetical protein
MAEIIFIAKGRGSWFRSAEVSPPVRAVNPVKRRLCSEERNNQGGTAKIFVPDLGAFFYCK